MTMTKWLVAAVALMLTAGSAQAHYVWLERDGTGVRAYFGEWHEDVREKAGATLDRIKSLTAFGSDRAKTLALSKQADHFAVSGAPKGDVRAVEERDPVEDKAKGGRTRTVFQAKEGRSETKPALDLELVPTAAGDDTFTLILRGQPLAKTDVHVFAPTKWGKDLRTDEAGKVTIPMPWAGRYVAEVIYLDETPGGAGEGAYDRIRHVATLSFTTAQGIAWK